MSNRHGLELRAATVADAPGIAALMSAAGRPLNVDDVAHRLEGLRQSQGTVFIALEWGPPSGLVVLHWHQTLAASRPVAQISTFVVSADARRRGIGRMLLKAASQAARSAGCDSLGLHASPENRDLRAFCLATGFAEDTTGFVRALRKRADRQA